MRRIAVVDDDERGRRLLVELLERDGHYVMPYSNGELALAHVLKERFDLVVLDVLMPGLDGIAVAREIRRHPDLAELRILALTGLTGPADAVRILEAGADAYLGKPVDLRDVRALVARLLVDATPPPGAWSPPGR